MTFRQRTTSSRLELDLITLERQLPRFRRVFVFVPALGAPVEVNRSDLLVKLRALRADRKLDKALVRVQGSEAWITFTEDTR